MRFAVSTEQQELRESVRRFLADRVPLSRVRELMETADGFDDLSWQQAGSQLGLQGIAIGEQYGGSGFSFAEQAIVLEELGAEFFFDAVALRPGKPTVFGWCRGKPVFGLPGNPVSTMVTFELFASPAIEILSGYAARPLPLFKAKLAHPMNEKGGVAHFLPARVSWRTDGAKSVTALDAPHASPANSQATNPAPPAGEPPTPEPIVEVLLWEGSGDIGAVVRGNCYLVVRPSRLRIDAGEWVEVLPRRGAL